MVVSVRIPTWRLALTGLAIVILLALGVGLVAASSNATPDGNGAPAAAGASSAGPSASGHPSFHGVLGSHGFGGLRGIGGFVGLGRFGGIGGLRNIAEKFVDGTFTYVDKDGKLQTIRADHGTIDSIGTNSFTIDEQGGQTVTVTTDSSTVVLLWGSKGAGKLSDLKKGDDVFVESQVDGTKTLAKHVVSVPPAPAPKASGG